MAKEPNYILINEEELRELMKTYYQQTYSILLLTYVCSKNNFDTTLTAPEACGVIGLSPRQIKDARDRCLIRSVNCGTFRLYSMYDLAMLAAKLHGKQMIPNLKNVPTIQVSKEHEP